MIAIAALVILLALGAAALLGLTPDTRDTQHGIGPFFSHRAKRATTECAK